MKFKCTKNKLICLIVTIIVLAATFWWGGNAPGLRGWSVKNDSYNLESANNDQKNLELEKVDKLEKEVIEEDSVLEKEISEKDSKEDKELEDSSKESDLGEKKEEEINEVKENIENKDDENKNTGIESRPGGTKTGLTAQEKIDLAKEIAESNSSSGVENGDTSYSESQGMDINPDTGKDKYLTDPVPEGKPIPVEPQDAIITDKAYTCTLSVRCDTILSNIEWLNPEKVELVPEDGVIFPPTKVTFYEGESVFNVLQREMKKAKIHMEFENTPMYNSAYIEGINNLYEFDCGELSGWMYKVNDWFPNYGCSRYKLKENDVIEWVYTCDLGVDVGGFSSVGN